MMLKQTGMVSIILTICLAAGCGSNSTSSAPRKEAASSGTGRYLEYEIPTPKDRDYIFCISPGEDGNSLDFVMKNTAENDLGFYTLAQSEFQRIQPDWMRNIPEGWSFEKTVRTPEGGHYALFQGRREDGSSPHICRVTADELIEIPISAEPGMTIRGFYTDGKGRFAIHQEPQGVILIGTDGAQTAEIPDCTGAAFFEDRLAVCDNKGVTFYDLNGNQQETIPHTGGSGKLSVGPDGGLYLALSTGIDRFLPESGSWKRVVDGSLCSLSNPNLVLRDFAMLDSQEFVAHFGNRAANRDVILTYRFSSETPAEPRHELTVCSLSRHDTIQLAAIEAQRANPDLRVKIDVRYDGEAEQTQISDALKSINTELLAGKGADVYVLNQMPYASYLSKGVLRDLSGFLAPYFKDGMLLRNVIEGYRDGSGIYALPLRFSVPLLWGDAPAVEAAADLTSLADWAQAHRELPVFYQSSPESIFRLFYPLSNPGDEARLQALLEDVKRVSGSVPVEPRFQPDWVRRYDEAGRLAGKNQLIAIDMRHPTEAAQCGEILRQTGGGTCRVLTGQVPNVYLTRLLVGVNAASAQQDLADEFLTALLSESVQDLTFFSEEGLPVNWNSLQKSVFPAENDKNEGFMIPYYYDETYEDYQELDYAWLTEAEGRKFLDLCRSVTTPGVDDSVLEEMILELAAPYWSDEQSIGETMEIINGKIKTYLGE